LIPSVAVPITNVGIGIKEKHTTDQGGRRVFTDLKPAAYTAKVEATGFKTVILENIVLRVGQQTDLDLKLEVGSSSRSARSASRSKSAPNFRQVGALLRNPEGGECGSSDVQYKPSVEAIQEFKLQNNSFSVEYGTNGGTVVSIVTKEGRCGLTKVSRSKA
jgi:hypothetical protein